ncbi:hypothetical protein QFW96_14835 [Saccharopolyspora sp. TS4A08]|uniref:ATP-binding protein n=1 Tax=Saccharopolyspora ipomoeae TaxID=3042027 RepID=A0ABT6PPN6_9PSEU|nr:hypothetical protein [Saccharopolyspora sp. TS4A08]MDI2029904.1 hypothetical protein [Saccharopolyspora sp. TS4A08]
MTEPVRLTDSAMLARRLLWNRAVDEPSSAQPVVVLLGPTGSGKTRALQSISQDCGNGVVHAQPFDFAREQPATTVEALATISDDLSRRWPARRSAKFTRFALGLVAVHTNLDSYDRVKARAAMNSALREFADSPRANDLAGQVDSVADAAEPVLDNPMLVTAAKLVLPRLIRTIGRRSLGSAKRWHADIPEAEGAEPLDALIQLSRRARNEPEAMTAWLTSAFLADVRESHPVMARPELGSPCACENEAGKTHAHNWVVLLDNLDNPGGYRFLDDIIAARERHLRQHNEHDPLLLIGTSGRWNPEWESHWHAPWKSAATRSDEVLVVPRCRDAGHWRSNPEVDRPQAHVHPVLLEPLEIEETASLIDRSPYFSEAKLAQRATAGLPKAVEAVAEMLPNARLREGRRDILEPAESTPEAWQQRLADLRVSEQLQDVDLAEFVNAAPFATAPWLVPAESTSLVSLPQTGRILTELRSALWVIAPDRDGGTEDQSLLHPWIARTLLFALNARGEQDGGSYETQFQALLDDPHTRRDLARSSYCRLALGRFAEVVGTLHERFDQIPHQKWVDLLILITSAPDGKPLHRDNAEVYADLVEQDLCDGPADRGQVRNVLARLIAAYWLLANPLAGPDRECKSVVVQSFYELAPLSHRPDVAALYEAARRADQLF